MNHLENRTRLLDTLREELVGPSPQGKAVTSGNLAFPTSETSYGPWRQENGEEILQRDPPIVRYGVGVLYPLKTAFGSEVGESADAGPPTDETAEEEPDAATETFADGVEALAGRAAQGEPGSDDLELPTANALQPSSMGLSFLIDLADDAELVIDVSGGQYRKKVVTVADKERVWWLRRPVNFRVGFPARELKTSFRTVKVFQSDPLHLSIEVFTRRHQGNQLVTVSLINRTDVNSSAKTAGSSDNEISLFQSGFSVSTTLAEAAILPYPSAPFAELDDEEQSLALLYREAETYAVGHGCAANWQVQKGERRAAAVRAECLPTFETPSTTPDITREDGSNLEVSMALLAGLVEHQDGFDALDEVVTRYEAWTLQKRAEAAALETRYQPAASEHLSACEKAARRMRGGLEYLRADSTARTAFRLANEAVLLQQVQSKRPLRPASFSRGDDRFTFSPRYEEPDTRTPGANRGSWRPFQIAFLLMALESACEGGHPERTEVELIWFPTGGGKTEAYLGLAAFSLLMRRLKNPADAGVHVLMRYTLRLLTAQQFQRASALICAVERLRRKRPLELGDAPFSIGIWLGGDTTPNRRQDAEQKLKDLERKGGGENPFILGRCPWCAAEMGVFEGSMPKTMSKADKILGYRRTQGTVAFYCPDKDCEFARALPVYVIDEDIYEHRPSIVIGTVDKFAVLAWNPKARALFGLGASGKRQASPPGLIIQDELHLISGPLGSMVGLYEALIEELCTDRRGAATPPKIVCSTATIRSYREQVRALYARTGVTLFPPPGLTDGDSFFARHAVDGSGERLPGRLYVGVNAPGLRSLETSQERTFAALLQAPMPLPPEERDPWWTLLLFFGSLRELGTSLSLFQSRIPDYFRTIKNRQGLDFKDVRYLYRPEELTGRLRNDEVPKALAKLEIACTPENTWTPGGKAVKDSAVDVCLASSIIEVGVDVDRLSLMAVVRQPKTTAQYIQVTGRVGRRWWERPGLVVTLYNPKNARDRSHFEQFRSFHERLYAQVEPTSVTPFAPPVLDRALHGVMVAYALQTGDEAVAESPYPYPEHLVETLRNLLTPRVRAVDPREAPYFEEVFGRRSSEWRNRQRTQWRSTGLQEEEIPLTVRAGEYVAPERTALTWKTPNSMRNVDAQCEAQITQLYLTREENE